MAASAHRPSSGGLVDTRYLERAYEAARHPRDVTWKPRASRPLDVAGVCVAPVADRGILKVGAPDKVFSGAFLESIGAFQGAREGMCVAGEAFPENEPSRA